ncbi:glutamine--fructose-6-phosphate transaminase (isomerizing) [Acuticoccus sp. MNP-M23]|uniref:glutamine--fructose-6-phosphate transaminase (isomerizing) n=1 Tax=Acuticoccus sp. MNP-M23 TaxID=3072793 RepID=UPI002815B640|nr:glutamine--fructose-6-phosphate transaminase (isomerizing) [Acuticoccus sp. MNP-M23]WMS41767.1 glutamine--fructose-6-phosphate transaminase (isomerizing) [Acuticoccus sp. MNP-M23]
MCGIVGIIGRGPAAPLLLDALKRLEYRGYDSAGIATVDADGTLTRARAAGKLRNLEGVLNGAMPGGSTGIGHTRWATHGAPTEANAHPHLASPVAVVHNGIIENFRALRTALAAKGVSFSSETDTETIAHLLAANLQTEADLKAALVETVAALEGAYSLAFAFEGQPGTLAAARRGSPLAIGNGPDGIMIGSDAIALAPFCDDIIYLEDGDIAILSAGKADIFDSTGAAVSRPAMPVPMEVSVAEKGNFRHFMAKEIHEQPEVLTHTISHYVDVAAGTLRPDRIDLDFSKISRISITACGTAYIAGLVARHWFEAFGGIAVDLDMASEYRYRSQLMPKDELALVISQSGETADTLASLRKAKAAGQRVAAVVNVRSSTMAREADLVLPTLAGIEIGVASTKAFVCQLATLACVAIKAGMDRGTLSESAAAALVGDLIEVPRLVSEAIRLEADLTRTARLIAPASTALYIGRGPSYGIALEGALKLKELSYIHAEGYAAGELKHGPIALVDDTVPVVVVAPHDAFFAKTVSNMEEVAARGGRIIVMTDAAGAAEMGEGSAETIVMPTAPAMAAPMVSAIPMQLLAYHAAVLNGTDVDQPRNLAKSVTVE